MEYPLKTPQQLGAVLQGLRRERRLTQAAAGAKVGLAQNAVSMLETNPTNASLARVFKLLSALELEIVVRDRRKRTSTTGW
jgi:HTH-type transcriptional regulator/antitoxin HipB